MELIWCKCFAQFLLDLLLTKWNNRCADIMKRGVNKDQVCWWIIWNGKKGKYHNKKMSPRKQLHSFKNLYMLCWKIARDNKTRGVWTETLSIFVHCNIFGSLLLLYRRFSFYSVVCSVENESWWRCSKNDIGENFYKMGVSKIPLSKRTWRLLFYFHFQASIISIFVNSFFQEHFVFQTPEYMYLN